jgi:hypothetical protein
MDDSIRDGGRADIDHGSHARLRKEEEGGRGSAATSRKNADPSRETACFR